MADPRETVRYDNLEEPTATFYIDSTITYDATKAGGSAQIGLAVTLTDDQIVGLCDDGDQVLGKLEKVEIGGACTVRHRGGMTLPGGTSATLTPGLPIVGDLLVSAKGYIQTAPATTAGALKGRGTLVDATDTAAVAVLL